MLTDIFAERYLNRPIWDDYKETDAKLLVQCFRMVSEQLIPYWIDGKESPTGKAKWKTLHERLSMELAMVELTPRHYSYQTTFNGKPHTSSGTWSYDKVCKDFVCSEYNGSAPPDRFMKERLSFIELAFRIREDETNKSNADLPANILQWKARVASKQRSFGGSGGMRVPGDMIDGMIAANKTMNAEFRSTVDELNERFRRAGAQLNYHNGFIQIATDALVEDLVETPFWEIVSDPKWKNVDIDMKEAIDRRDANDRDPAFYAARALESAIKIISAENGWTHGGEKGAHNYIDNLSSKKNCFFISGWEQELLKKLFTDIRNPFGHGPGSGDMPELTLEQTNWTVETCMSWIKSLIQRM